jgi:hypothetical protein
MHYLGESTLELLASLVHAEFPSCSDEQLGLPSGVIFLFGGGSYRVSGW